MRNLVILGLILAACTSSNGGGDGGGGDACPGADLGDPSQRFEPWVTGNAWSYKLTDPQNAIAPATGRKTTVMGQMDVGGAHAGQQAFLVHVEQLVGSKDVFETIQGDLDIRYQSTFYDASGAITGTDVDQPYRLKLDESPAHTMTGATFSTTFTEVSDGGAPKTKTEAWRVVCAGEPVSVIAGTFNSLHVQRTSSGGAIQDYWYVRGVGKVKETGSNAQWEELESFNVTN